MKKYESAKIELVKFSSEDVLATSNVPQELGFGNADDHKGVNAGSIKFSDTIEW